MGESFVDLSYRGLPLGRRIKLTQIRPSTGYLELAAPMPVGTAIAIATDEGVGIDAIVTQVSEQATGVERPPGMIVAPALADAAAAAWWQARVALPEADPAEAAPRPVVVLPRSRTPSTAPPVGAATAAAAAGPPAPSQAEPPASAAEVAPSDDLAGADADAPLVDDGKKTIMMHSVDLSALGLDAGASGHLSARDVEAAAEGDDEGEGEGDDEGGHGEDDGAARDVEADAAAPTGSNGDPRQPVVSDDQQKAAGKKRKKRR